MGGALECDTGLCGDGFCAHGVAECLVRLSIKFIFQGLFYVPFTVVKGKTMLASSLRQGLGAQSLDSIKQQSSSSEDFVH